VIAKYNEHETRALRSMGEIQSTEKQSETEMDVTAVQADSGFDFESI